MSSQLLTTDRLGSPLVALSSLDNVSRTYGPYGHFRNTSGAVALGFTGQRFEASMGGYLLGSYRVYSPVLMRFHSADSWSPFGGGGGNAYAYCAGDPVNRSDPSGHMLTAISTAAPYIGMTGNMATASWVMLGKTPETNFDLNVARGMSLGAWGGLGVKIAKQFVPEGPAKVGLNIAEAVFTGIGALFSGARSVKAIKNSGKDTFTKIKKNGGVLIGGLSAATESSNTSSGIGNETVAISMESPSTGWPEGLRRRNSGSSSGSESDLSSLQPGTPPPTPFAMGGTFDISATYTSIRNVRDHEHSD